MRRGGFGALGESLYSANPNDQPLSYAQWVAWMQSPEGGAAFGWQATATTQEDYNEYVSNFNFIKQHAQPASAAEILASQGPAPSTQPVPAGVMASDLYAPPPSFPGITPNTYTGPSPAFNPAALNTILMRRGGSAFRSSGASMAPRSLGRASVNRPTYGPRPIFPRYGLGQSPGEQKASGVVQAGASTAGAAFGTASAIGGAGSAAAGLAATAVPIIGIAAAVILLALKFFGKGCGAACTVTAQLHQIVSATEDNIIAVAHAGLISGPEAQAALQGLIQTGEQIEEQASQYPKQVAASIKQFTDNIKSSIEGLSDLPATPSQPWSLSAARALYVGHGTGSGIDQACGPGTWYCQSITQADSLSDQILQSIISNRSSAAPATTSTGAPASSSGLISSVESEAESVGVMTPAGGMTALGWLVIAGLGIAGVMAFRGKLA